MAGRSRRKETPAILCPNELMINISRHRQPGSPAPVGPRKRDAVGEKEGLRVVAKEQRDESHSRILETQGCRINKLLPVVPPRKQRAKIKGGHCGCQGHLVRAIYFLDLLIAEVFTRVLKQQKLTDTIREISGLRPFCHLLTLKTLILLHSLVLLFFL